MNNFEKINRKEETIRSDAVMNDLINSAIAEVVEAFSNEMTPRDREMLEAVAGERSTNPIGRVMYLRQIPDSQGVTKELHGYINQVLTSLRQELTHDEVAKFQAWGFSSTGTKKNLLDDI